jgi:hypothetical protein
MARGNRNRKFHGGASGSSGALSRGCCKSGDSSFSAKRRACTIPSSVGLVGLVLLLFAVHRLGRKTQTNRDAGPRVNRYVERRTHPARAPTCASDRPAPSREWLEQAQGIGAAYGNASEELIYSFVRAGKRQSTAKKCNHEVPRSTMSWRGACSRG